MQEIEPTRAPSPERAASRGNGEPERDGSYWERILGDSYAAHLQQEEAERIRIERSLGKGKRQRRKINYAEAAMVTAKELSKNQVTDNDDQYNIVSL